MLNIPHRNTVMQVINNINELLLHTVYPNIAFDDYQALQSQLNLIGQDITVNLRPEAITACLSQIEGLKQKSDQSPGFHAAIQNSCHLLQLILPIAHYHQLIDYNPRSCQDIYQQILTIQRSTLDFKGKNHESFQLHITTLNNILNQLASTITANILTNPPQWSTTIAPVSSSPSAQSMPNNRHITGPSTPHTAVPNNATTYLDYSNHAPGYLQNNYFFFTLPPVFRTTPSTQNNGPTTELHSAYLGLRPTMPPQLPTYISGIISTRTVTSSNHRTIAHRQARRYTPTRTNNNGSPNQAPVSGSAANSINLADSDLPISNNNNHSSSSALSPKK